MTFNEKQKFEEKAKYEGNGGILRTVFSRGRVEISSPINPIEFNERTTNIRFSKLKKLLLLIIICALALTVLLIIKQITVKDTPSAIQMVDSNAYLNSTANQLISDTNTEEVTERITQTSSTTTTTEGTTTTTTTTTTPAPRILDHLLASLVINNATVPNKDGYMSLTDTYVKAYVDDNYIGQTPVQKENLNPQWNYQIAHQMILRPDSVLKFKLYDNDKYSSHEFLGEIEAKTSELIADGSNGQLVQRWHGSGHLWFTVTWDEVYRNN